MRLRLLPFLLPIMLILTCSKESSVAEDTPCSPTFREVSPEPIVSEVGSWRVIFMVALVGCTEDLDTISDREQAALIEEFRSPSEWSNLQLVKQSGAEDFRARAVARVNALVGRKSVSDVLFHDVNLFDHSSFGPTVSPTNRSQHAQDAPGQ